MVHPPKSRKAKSGLTRNTLRKSLFEESNIQQKENYHHQSKGNDSSGIDVENIGFFLHEGFLRIKATTKQTIAASVSNVKINNLPIPFSSEKLGTIITAPIQPADRLTNKSERTDDQIGSNLIRTNLSSETASVNDTPECPYSPPLLIHLRQRRP